MKKIFLTVLGTGDYSDCYYYYKNDFSCRSRFIQDALLKYLYQDNYSDVEVKLLLTDKAKKKNYDDTDQNSKNLKSIFDKLNIHVDLIKIPEGKTEKELWDIFEQTVNSIEDDYEINLDITHSLRNIPIQILVGLNYTKLFKNIKINGIYYGAFELGVFKDDDLNPGEMIKHSPICNLNVYYELLNWTNAVNSFIHTGNSSEILSLYEQKKVSIFKSEKDKGKLSAKDKQDFKKLTNVVTSLNNFTQCINTCRGQCNSFISNKNVNLKSIGIAANTLYEHINILNDSIDTINEDIIIPPSKYLFDLIKEKIYPFINKSPLEIGMATVKWCIDYKLYQQGYTALDESLKTFICDLLKINSTEKYNREEISNTILNCLDDYIKVKNYRIETETIEDHKIVIDSIEKFKENKPFCNLVKNVRDKRNDINHFGFNSAGATPYSKFISELENYYNSFLEIRNSMIENTNI